MSKEEAGAISQELFRIDGKPSVSQALPLAMQHVVAMIVGCVTPAIIVAGVAELSPADSVILIHHKAENQRIRQRPPHIPYRGFRWKSVG